MDGAVISGTLIFITLFSLLFELIPSEQLTHHQYKSLLNGIVGVGRLRTRYGSRKDRGSRPERFRKGGGKIIRVILQQSEAASFVEKIKTSKKTGRQLTIKGKEFLDSIK